MVLSVVLYAFTGHAYVKWLIRSLMWLLPVMCRAASLIIKLINILTGSFCDLSVLPLHTVQTKTSLLS